MGWRLAREAQGDAFGLDRQGDAGTEARARRAGVFKRTRTCADLVGRQSASLMGVQLGNLAEWAAMRQRFMVRSGSMVLADAPSLARRFAGSRRPRIAAPRWGTSRSGSEA